MISSKRRISSGMVSLRFEPLETRELLSAALEPAPADAVSQVMPAEQLLVYELNRARHDPIAYQHEQNLPIDLSYVEPRPPLAVNDSLFGSARFHAEDMAAGDYFGHQSEVTGDWPNKMARDHGYPLAENWPDDDNFIESIAAGYPTTMDALNGLIIDEGVPSLGHRIHLLGISDFSADDREIGVGYAFAFSSDYRYFWGIHATRSDPADTFLTGVVFNDLNRNRRYDADEGLPGVTLSAGEQTTITNAQGGWSLAVAAGTHTVTASGGALRGTAGSTVLVEGENLEIDFLSGQDWGIVDFDDTPAPLASNDLYTALENTTITVPASSGVLINDTADGEITAVLEDEIANGELTLRGNGSFTYVPLPGFHGTDGFTYRVRRGRTFSDPATVSITVVRPLGTVDFLQIADQDPSTGDLWYRAQSTRSGFFTVQASFSDAGGDAGLTLHDPTFKPLTASMLTEAGRRVDAQAAAAAETFYFRLTGDNPNVDLRVANLVQLSADGAQMTVHGSRGDDTVEVTAGLPMAAVVNAVGYEFPAVAEVRLLGAGGSDAVTFYGSAGDEVATLSPGSATVTGSGYRAQFSDVASVTLYGGGGTDELTLVDSAGDDQFVGTPTYAALSGDGFSHRAWNFARVKAEATAGGIDVAKFYDSLGDDTYVATPDYNALSGEGFHNEIWHFEGVHAYATAGGVDLAKFYDSPHDDDFIATPTYAALYNEQYQGQYSGSFYNRAKFFESVHAFATDGGLDLARFYDSPGHDDFIATPTYAALYNTQYEEQYTRGFYNRAKFFESVHAFATDGGVDLARLYDSPGDDVFYADPTEGALYDAGQYYNRAKFFEGVHAYATAGGTDEARLHGSDGDDRLVADPDQAALFRPGQYYNRAKFFQRVYADAGYGSADVADLYDSPSADRFQAADDWAMISNAVLDFLYRATAFDRVTAIATTSNNTAEIKWPLAFSVQLDGPWPGR